MRIEFDAASAPPIAPPLRHVIKRWAMKPQSALILLLALAVAPPAFSLRLEPVRNDTKYPRPVVDIEDLDRGRVAQLYVMPGETMKLDSQEVPVAGAGYYQAMPGEEFYLIISPKSPLPRFESNLCPCVLRVDKVGWDRAGKLMAINGLRPFLQTAGGGNIAIVSDVNHPRIVQSRLYFKLQGHRGEYWVLTQFGQIVDAGGPWGLWEFTRFLLFPVLPLLLACALVYSVVHATLLFRQDSHPDKSFIELMQLSLTRLPLILAKFRRG